MIGQTQTFELKVPSLLTPNPLNFNLTTVNYLFSQL